MRVERRRFYRIFCGEKDKKGKRCGNCLGDIEITRTHVSRMYCRREHSPDGRKLFFEYEVMPDGTIVRRILPQDFRERYYDTVVVLKDS